MFHGTARGRGRHWPLALFLSWLPAAAAADAIVVIDDSGETLGSFELAPGERWCLSWHHSVAGFEVNDCFVFDPPRLVLDSSHQPDFAAGLGHIAGRGVQVSDAAGGYRIESIDEPVPGNRLRLRVGSRTVDHRIEHAGGSIALSELAPHHAVEIRLVASTP